MRTRRLLALAATALVVLGAAAFALAWHPAIPPLAGAQAPFPPAQVATGANLAAIGDCAVCHTAEHGRPYAGGRPVPTPFGAIYATNITPDPDTGIGAWSEPAFRRAMRDGIARDGAHLYPVLPYPHFTRATDADLGALYAFVMSRTPVQQSTPPNRLPFPFGIRATLAAWNLLYLRPGPFTPDAEHDERWNRGAYLTEAVGHCGACHTPRDRLGGEHGGAYAGGQAEGWYAPPLQLDSPAHHPWTEDELATYLRTGFQSGHGAAAGPMTAVTDNLAAIPEPDIRAMAAYIASLMPSPAVADAKPGAPPAPPPRPADPVAQASFTGACGGCHAATAPMTQAGLPPLSLATGLNAPTSQALVNIILHGIPWRDGRPTQYMPAFADTLTDAQVTALAAYLRAQYTDKPAWTDIPAQLKNARKGGGA